MYKADSSVIINRTKIVFQMKYTNFIAQKSLLGISFLLMYAVIFALNKPHCKILIAILNRFIKWPIKNLSNYIYATVEIRLEPLHMIIMKEEVIENSYGNLEI